MSSELVAIQNSQAACMLVISELLTKMLMVCGVNIFRKAATLTVINQREVD